MRTSPETIYFFASVPKAIAGRKAPFPVALYGHGYTSMRLEGVLLAVQVHDPGLIGAFAGGMLSFLSPCVLPLVPGYLSMVSGISVAELQVGDPGNLRRIIVSTLLFVAGFTAVFVALGAAASGLGQALREHQRGLEMIAGAFVMAMGIFLAGFVSPAFLMMERRLHVSPSEVGAWARL